MKQKFEGEISILFTLVDVDSISDIKDIDISSDFALEINDAVRGVFKKKFGKKKIYEIELQSFDGEYGETV